MYLCYPYKVLYKGFVKSKGLFNKEEAHMAAMGLLQRKGLVQVGIIMGGKNLCRDPLSYNRGVGNRLKSQGDGASTQILSYPL